jgi:hypothetical protein
MTRNYPDIINYAFCKKRVVTPSIRLHGIRLLKIKPLGLMDHDTRHLSINGLNNDLYMPIIVANPRPNPSTLKGRRRWKMINTTWSHLFGCKA